VPVVPLLCSTAEVLAPAVLIMPTLSVPVLDWVILADDTTVPASDVILALTLFESPASVVDRPLFSRACCRISELIFSLAAIYKESRYIQTVL